MNQMLISAKHKIIGVPSQGNLETLFPEAKHLHYGNDNLILLDHDIITTHLLRSMGMDAPAPVLTHYDWAGGSPFEVQRKTVAMLTQNARAYVLNGMGTGKTKAALWAWHYLKSNGFAEKLLVVAPLSTLNFTWGKEIFQTLPGIRYVVLHGTKEQRLRRLKEDYDIYIVNHDGLGIIHEAVLKRPDIDTLVLDELAVYRNPTNRTKIARTISHNTKWVWGMTGSPVPNAPTDAYAQCTIVTPGTVPRYFNRFRDEVMLKVSTFKYVPKKEALEKVFEAMQPAVRYTLDDVVELPDLVTRTIDVDMGPKQAKVYDEMKRFAISLVESKEITAMNAGAVLNKLLQISTGYVYTREHEIVPLDNDERMTALVDAINSTDRKVIVFVPFVHALNAIRTKLEAEGYDVRAVSGATPRKEREEVFNLFQNTDKVRIIVAHPACMSHGLTLTAADTIIWFGPLADLEVFEQANARITRIGQKHKQQIIMLQATAAERNVYAKLWGKQRIQDTILDLFSHATL